VAQVVGEDLHALVLGELPEAHAQVELDGDPKLRAPRPAGAFQQPPVPGPVPVLDAEAQGHPALVETRVARLLGGLVLQEAEIQHLLLLAPEQGEDAVGRELGQGWLKSK
jgi:hypothetical protein